MNHYVRSNLNITKDASSVASFLDEQNWRSCEKFFYYACTSEKFSDDDYREYLTSWLCENEVAIVCEGRTLKFNFPRLGILLRQIFRKFSSHIMSAEELADKHHFGCRFLF